MFLGVCDGLGKDDGVVVEATWAGENDFAEVFDTGKNFYFFGIHGLYLFF